MATTNATGGKTADVRMPATQTVKATAATAQAATTKAAAKTPLAAPAVVVKINQAVAAAALPTYTAAGKTNTAAKAPEPVKTTPQPAAAAKAAQPAAAPAAAAKAATPAPAAAAKAATPAPAAAAKAATPAPAAAAKTSSAQVAPAADGSLYATGEGSVKVDIMASDSGYENKIFWSADNWKTRNYLGVDNNTGSYDLGKFAKGTKIEFGIDNGQGDFFKTGGGNTDGFQHTRVSGDPSSMTVGFEDLRGGGDQDFNDAIIRVSGTSNAQPAPATVAAKQPEPAKPAPAPVVAKPAPAPATPAKVTKDNRSGLGDGTNPGNGDGRVNSPNKGTENPNQSSKTVAAPVTAPAKTTPATTAKTVAAKKV